MELSTLANTMTYKLLFSTFPFLVFLLTLLGFFTIDFHVLTDAMQSAIPAEILGVVEVFAHEVVNVRRPKLLSLSLLLAIVSSTSGFRSLVAGLKKAYHQEESRSTIKIYGHSLLLVILFTGAMFLSALGIIFGDTILGWVAEYFYLNTFTYIAYNIVSIAASLAVMLAVVVIINCIALGVKLPLREVLPGAVFTVAIWALAGFAFNLYIRNFSDMTKVYGSVAGIMVLLIWLNIICIVLLVGGALNGVLKMRKEGEN